MLSTPHCVIQLLLFVSFRFDLIYTFIAFLYCFSQMEACCSFGLNLFEISFVDCEVRTSMVTSIPPPTDHNWHKLATPPYFYRDWNWQRLPGPMAYGYHIVSEKMNQCPISGYSNECSREKWENTHPCRKISIFAILKLRHCYLVLMIYTFR